MKHSLLSVYKFGFLLCSKLSESYGGWLILVDLLMLLYGYLQYQKKTFGT